MQKQRILLNCFAFSFLFSPVDAIVHHRICTLTLASYLVHVSLL